jgi:hypothetical protein
MCNKMIMGVKRKGKGKEKEKANDLNSRNKEIQRSETNKQTNKKVNKQTNK